MANNDASWRAGVAARTEGGFTFRVWAPFAEAVAISGDFNNWSHTQNMLTRGEGGYFSTDITHAYPGQEYNYIITAAGNTFVKNDPRALQLSASGKNAVIVEGGFDWEGDEFTIAPVNELVIYELHIGTFYRPDLATPGTFETAEAKLDYLADLGINAIELMPISGSATDQWWGYTPDYIYAVEASYGGRWAFQRFVKAAHQRGIAVIVDVVYNHLCPENGCDLWQFDGWSENNKGGIYFYNDWRSETPWGDTRPDFGRPEVRDYIADNARMWLVDCHVDGLRCDATSAIRRCNRSNYWGGAENPEGKQLLQRLTAEAAEARPSIMIAEDLQNDPQVTAPAQQDGLGFNAQWDAAFAGTLRERVDQPDDAWRELGWVASSLQSRYNNDAFGRVIYVDSHDTDANGHARLGEEIAPGDGGNIFARRRTALAAALLLTAPGIPMLLQGQEFMESGVFNHWQALDWHKAETYGGIVQLYKDLIGLRRNQRQRSQGLLGQSIAIMHHNEATKVLAYHRWDQGGRDDDVLIVTHFANQERRDYSLDFPRPGAWKVRFNSDWQGYSPDFGNMPTPDVVVDDKTGVLNLAPYSVLILSQDP